MPQTLSIGHKGAKIIFDRVEHNLNLLNLHKKRVTNLSEETIGEIKEFTVQVFSLANGLMSPVAEMYVTGALRGAYLTMELLKTVIIYPKTKF